MSKEPAIDELSANEKLWFDRLKKAIIDGKGHYYVSWWLRLDYESEKVSTATINYWLTKLVKRGLVEKVASKYCTKYYLVKPH